VSVTGGWIDPFEAWARGRWWAPRALLVAGFAWLAGSLAIDPARSTVFDAIDLAIHEAGHLLLRPGGETLHTLGGTLLQLLVPVVAAVLLARRPDWFGAAFCGVWLGVNLYDVARYIADARAQSLPLVTVGGGEARHDWSFLLGQLGWLRSDRTIAGLVRALAFLVIWSSTAAGAALAYLIWRSGRRTKTAPATSPPRPTRGSRSRAGRT